MTKSKGLRLIQELIAKYGDVEIVCVYDYYATRIYEDPNDARTSKKPEDVIIKSIKLSNLEGFSNREDFKTIEAIASGKQRPIMQPVIIDESKEIYDSPSQQLIRKKHSQDFHTMMGNLFHMNLQPYYNLHKVDMMLNNSPSPKEYGMALSNSNKRRR